MQNVPAVVTHGTKEDVRMTKCSCCKAEFVASSVCPHCGYDPDKHVPVGDYLIHRTYKPKINPTKPMFLRKCFVLREVQVEMKDLKKGDVFRLGKAAPDDCVNEKEYSVASGDAYSEPPEGNIGVTAEPVVLEIKSRSCGGKQIDQQLVAVAIERFKL